MKRDHLKFDANDSPPLYMCIVMALTHVLLIFDGIIFIPNILGKTAGIPSATLQFITFGAILVSALFTFVQSRHSFGIGAGFILFTGSYSAFLLCSVDAVSMGGLPLLASMSLLTVPLVFLYTFFIRFFRHIITPAVGGVVILLIAISLVPIGLELWTGNGDAATAHVRPGIGAITVLSLTLLMLFGSTILRLWSPIIAMAAGYGTAWSTGELHFKHALHAAWIGLPPVSAWPGLETGISGVHIPLLFAFSMAMLASMIENTGTIMLVQRKKSKGKTGLEFVPVSRACITALICHLRRKKDSQPAHGPLIHVRLHIGIILGQGVEMNTPVTQAQAE
ncbi:MAG TPA: solute carrier family 23 protein [Desulfomicrobiaceae bacterium]|nr:solute carrier family 23 protein [Desulfomicrobiaceae bacterium]